MAVYHADAVEYTARPREADIHISQAGNSVIFWIQMDRSTVTVVLDGPNAAGVRDQLMSILKHMDSPPRRSKYTDEEKEERSHFG